MFTQTEINSAINSISKKVNANKIFLFGSYASGNPTPDSDLDLCVVADLQGKRKLDLIRDIRREVNMILQGSLDILLYSEDEFNQRASLENTLEYKILKHGKLLNG
ncbi:MAG: nucleotidyltransferase domain-containing protein [Chloroflexota bacterium]|nr:nucleotidyltransferase domain-containing protein [Chloroflexota bacterium]